MIYAFRKVSISIVVTISIFIQPMYSYTCVSNCMRIHMDLYTRLTLPIRRMPHDEWASQISKIMCINNDTNIYIYIYTYIYIYIKYISLYRYN